MWDPQAPGLVAGNWGSQVATCPSPWRFLHQQAALSFGQRLGTLGPTAPQTWGCAAPSPTPRGLSHTPGVGWDSVGGGQAPRCGAGGGLGVAQLFLGLSYEKSPLRPHPRVSLSEAKLRAGECQHRRHGTWLVVPAGDSSVLGSSVLFITPGRSRANTAAPPHGPVTSSPCLNSRWANRWR